MLNEIKNICYPSPIAEDDIIRASVTLEIAGNVKYTHNESVWKGVNCIGSIFGRGMTDAPAEYREEALEAIEGMADILVNEYGMEEWKKREPEDERMVMEEVNNE